MNKQQARGYLLEIVLSKLIEVNGYEVITEEIIGNTDEFKSCGRNGLKVKGRGGYHQFDTLGTFRVTPPFVYPLRLFVEAKFYSPDRPVGIEKVRMGVGILDDINTNYSTVNMTSAELFLARYNYHYAIFSTSGFSNDAQRYAIAHKIHLIDLSGSEYKYITDSIENIVDILMFDTNQIEKNLFESFKRNFSYLIYTEEEDEWNFKQALERIDNRLVPLILSLRTNIKGKYIFLATINSVNMIPLFADSAFNELLKSNPHQNISIHFNQENSDEWAVVPIDNYGNEIKALSARFTLPELFREYMKDDLEKAMYMKEKIFGKIVFIAYLDKRNPTLCTLTFDKSTTLLNPW
ncbi:MAG: hypothetical protein E6734_05440 [Veillonella dispar]|uniref:hypothetical protein n=1 Tax=Veillonella dispar TaxID=39778 RepID=UPI00290385E1|nr:hypothetical protein E6734_05440 [Veillonella dispar]MDU1986739.1 hypothetical protein [Veillonella dispar]